MAETIPDNVKRLIEKGVDIPLPGTVLIGNDVDPDRISGNGVVLYPGTKIFGKDTFIHDHSVIGFESPVTLDNCQLGCRVHLKGGYFSNAVFLDDVAMGSGSHVREGTICEEGSSVAHTVGLKQTILFPYVTLGSLINFCDCFMTGGTSRKDHSEVGSSYIHFNYTPNQDKATASLLGDVPRGVMLKERPIFLGGQGGLVGPCRLSFGTVVAAGTIVRKDELRENRLIVGDHLKGVNLPAGRTIRQNTKRIAISNIHYIANLISLKQYYLEIRALFICEKFPRELLAGLLDKADRAINERIKRLDGFCKNISDESDRFSQKWPEIKKALIRFQDQITTGVSPDNFKQIIEGKIAALGAEYIPVIKDLADHEAAVGTTWLQSIVDKVNTSILDNLYNDK